MFDDIYIYIQKIKLYNLNFKSYRKTLYSKIIVSVLLFFLVFPLFTFFGFLVNSLDKSSIEDRFLREIDEKSIFELTKEGFYYFIFYLIITIPVYSFFAVLAFINFRNSIYSIELSLSFILSVSVSFIIYLTLVPLIKSYITTTYYLEYADKRSFMVILTIRPLKRLISKEYIFYILIVFLLNFIHFLASVILTSGLGYLIYPLMEVYTNGILGLTNNDEKIKKFN